MDILDIENTDNFKKFLLGTTPTGDDKEIKGCCLPYQLQNLLCQLAHFDSDAIS